MREKWFWCLGTPKGEWDWGKVNHGKRARSQDEAGDISGALRMTEGCVATVRSSDIVLRTNKSQWGSEWQN